MNRRWILACLLGAACSVPASTEAPVESSRATVVSSRTRPRGRVTFVIDDGRRTDLTVKFPIFQSRGVPAVVAVPTMWRELSDQELLDLQNIYGWEIANHSKFHRNETQLSDSALFEELYDSRVAFQQMGLKVNFHVYPFGMSNPRVEEAVSEFYRGGILAWGGLNPLPLRNKFAVTRTILDSKWLDRVEARSVPGAHGVNGPYNLSWWTGMVRRAERRNSWLIVSIHELVPEDQALLGDLIDYIKARGSPDRDTLPGL